MIVGRIRAVLVFSLCLTACGQRETGSTEATQTAALPEGVVADVGGQPILKETVSRIARAQRLSLQDARDLAISDALFAVAAQDRFGDRGLDTLAHRIALSRTLLEGIKRGARARGLPTVQEVTALTEARWWELDRPELRRTVHAIAQVKAPEEEKKAKEAIIRIETAVKGLTEASAFEKAAKEITVEGLDIRVEQLDPVARDTRIVDPDNPPPPGYPAQHFAKDFVEAVYSINEVGEQVRVRTEFGYHLILFVARYDEKRFSAGERRRMVADEIYRNRAEKEHTTLLENLRGKANIAVELAAGDLTGKIQVEP